MKWARRIFAMLSLGGAFFAVQVFAQSSASFQNTQSTFAPAVFSVTSSNFSLSGSVEPIVGNSVSPSYNVFSGVPLVDPPVSVCGNGVVESGEACDSGGSNGACPQTCSTSCTANSCGGTPPPGGGGGGGPGGGGGGGEPTPTSTTTTPPTPPPTPSSTGYMPPPTLLFKSPTFKSVRLVHGSRPPEATEILVNGSTNGVRLLDPLRWERDLPLFLGLNDVFVVARNSTATSAPAYGQVDRMLIGDVDRSRHVDDVDLSLFTRAWHTYNFFADFNEDTVIDDADLSLLASHWNQSF